VAAGGAAPSGKNWSVLIHSAAGDVGSMLVQMSAALSLGAVVGLVGRPDKEAGCNAVTDKSGLTPSGLWEAAARATPSYAEYKTGHGRQRRLNKSSPPSISGRGTRTPRFYEYMRSRFEL